MCDKAKIARRSDPGLGEDTKENVPGGRGDRILSGLKMDLDGYMGRKGRGGEYSTTKSEKCTNTPRFHLAQVIGASVGVRL
jgi:hypothetical protein